MEGDDVNYLLDAVYSVINALDTVISSGDISTDFQILQLKRDYLQRLLVNLEVDDCIVEMVGQASKMLFDLDETNQEQENLESRTTVPVVNTRRRGRPAFDIKEEQVTFLLEHGFKVAEIANMKGASKRTKERRMSTFGLTVSGKWRRKMFYIGWLTHQ